MSNVVEASPEEPYLNLRIDLEPAAVASLTLEAKIEVKKGGPGGLRVLKLSKIVKPE